MTKLWQACGDRGQDITTDVLPEQACGRLTAHAPATRPMQCDPRPAATHKGLPRAA